MALHLLIVIFGIAIPSGLAALAVAYLLDRLFGIPKDHFSGVCALLGLLLGGIVILAWFWANSLPF